MAEEVQGQAAEQPAAPLPESMNQHEAVSYLSEQMRREEKPRGEDGKFLPTKAKETPEAPEEKAEEEAPPEDTEEAPPPRKLKIKYKGEDREVDEPEAVELAQKGYDYTQKMQQIAKDREEIQTKIRAETEKAQKDYEQRLSIQRKALEKLAGFEEVDLNKLSQEDPVRAQQEFFKRVAFNEQIRQIEAEQHQLTQARQTEMQASIRKQAEASVEALQTKIPGWGNDLYGKVLKTAVKDYGFQQQEVNAITDHRAIEVLHDAMKWREFKAAKPTVDKKVASVPKVTKPGTAEKPDPKAQKTKEIEARLSKTGHRNDAVDMIRELLDSGKIS